jgi:cobalt-zinc-cadmium efflux system outer membrane protein
MVAADAEEVLTIQEALTLAEENSPQLRVAKAQAEAAAGEAQQASAWLNPDLEFDMENFAGSGSFGSTDMTEYTYALSQKLEVGGKRSARSDAALRRLEAAQADYAVARRVLNRDVTTLYMAAVAAAQNFNVAKEQESLADKVLTTVTRRVEAAREPKIQQRKAKVAHETAILKRQQAGREVQVARTALSAMWGEALLNKSLQVGVFFKVSQPEDFTTYELQLADAPQLERYQSLIEAQRAEASLAQAQNVPDPTFRLGVRDFSEKNDQALVAGLSFPLPVFNRNSGNIRKALSQIAVAEQQQSQARLTLVQQLRASWQAWQQGAQEAERLQSSIIPAAKEAFVLAQEGYDRGRFPYLDVLDAQRTLFEARAQYNDALLRMHMARASVMALTKNPNQI